MVHVPYRGEGPALVDLIAGQVPVMIPSLPPSIEFIKAGRLRPLAVTMGSPSEALPDVPVMSRFVPTYEASAWVGFVAPKNTPAQIVSLLNKELNEGLDNARIRIRLL